MVCEKQKLDKIRKAIILKYFKLVNHDCDILFIELNYNNKDN